MFFIVGIGKEGPNISIYYKFTSGENHSFIVDTIEKISKYLKDFNFEILAIISDDEKCNEKALKELQKKRQILILKVMKQLLIYQTLK